MEEKRENVRRKNPSLTDEELAGLDRSPYEVVLQHSKSLANEVLDIVDVKIVGDQAEVTVVTNSGSINGRPVATGRAHVEMVGEGSLWRVKTNVRLAPDLQAEADQSLRSGLKLVAALVRVGIVEF